MQSRGLYIATAVLVVLGGLWYWSQHRKPTEDTSKPSADTPPTILKLDEASITHVQLSKKDSPPVVFEKNASGEWQITFPKPLRADQNAVSGLVGTVSSLNSERLVEDKASNPSQYGLSPATLQIDLSEKDNKSQKLLIGDDTPTGGATYAMLAGDPRVFTIASYTKASLDKGVNDLRDKRLITANADNISRVELVKKGSDIEFGRNKDRWQILKPKPLRANGTEVGELVRRLTDAKMDASADASKESSAFAKASAVATANVTDSSGTQQVEIRKVKDNYYAKSSAVEGAYKIDSTVGKQVEKNLDDFRNKSLFDFGFNSPNKVEVHNGNKSYFLTRGTAGEDDWWSNGKKMDGTKVSDLVSKLRDLSATGFSDSGFANPTIELSVTSNDGKRVENVSIAKSGDGYLAQRKDEPTWYKLSDNSVDDLIRAAGAL
jgi:hypothetical protein